MRKKSRKILNLASITASIISIALPINLAITNIASANDNEVVKTNDISCPDLRVVFARGSGGTRWQDENYLTFINAVKNNIENQNLTVEYIDLDYPAIAVGFTNIKEIFTTVGTYFRRGDSGKFGESVNTGVENLTELVNTGCKNTKYVLGGYSQGAMVISKSLSSLNSNKIIYAATFGDPKIYLPEGIGVNPDACQNKNLSEYREYVPDCHADYGLLGSYIPYQPEGFSGKLGTWCNTHDIFCSSYVSVSDHLAYDDDDLYVAAAKVIGEKVSSTFSDKTVQNTSAASTKSDTEELNAESSGDLPDTNENSAAEVVIMIAHDYRIKNGSNWSELTTAKNLAKKIIGAGGKVSIYYYSTATVGNDSLHRECNFDECSTTSGIDDATASSNGNLISVQNSLDLADSVNIALSRTNFTSTNRKLVILSTRSTTSDATNQIKTYAKNFSLEVYTVTDLPFITDDYLAEQTSLYAETTENTGASFSYGADGWEEALTSAVLNINTQANISSKKLANILPTGIDGSARVIKSSKLISSAFLTSETSNSQDEIPSLKITNFIVQADETAKLNFENTGTDTIVILNDVILGTTKSTEIVVELEPNQDNTIRLVPVTDTRRGTGDEIKISALAGYGNTQNSSAYQAAADNSNTKSSSSDQKNVDSSSQSSPNEITSENKTSTDKTTIPKVPNTGRK